MNFNNVLNHIKPSASMKIGLNKDSSIYTNFAIGAPDINPPAELVEILRSRTNLPSHSYTPVAGTAKAKSNLAHILSDGKREVTANEIALIEGAKYGIYLAMKSLCNKCDKVMLLEPYWLSYPQMANALELSISVYKPIINHGELLYSIKDILNQARTEKVSAVILNNPNNPSGQLMQFDDVMELATGLYEAGIWLIIDEVYKDLVFTPSQHLSFNINYPNVIRVGSFSKSLCIPGLRLGYMIADPSILEKLLLIGQHMQTCVNTYALAVAENMTKKMLKDHSTFCSNIYLERYTVLKNLLSNSGLEPLNCYSSFYSFVDFSKYFSSAAETCSFLLEKHNILATPGDEYGDGFRHYVRFCLTQPKEVIFQKFQAIIKEGF